MTGLATSIERAIGGSLLAHFHNLRIRHADKDVSLANIATQFCKYYESGQRIEVAFCHPDGTEYERKRGIVSITTGWQPVFILMLKSNSHGSSWTLGEHDKVVAIRIDTACVGHWYSWRKV